MKTTSKQRSGLTRISRFAAVFFFAFLLAALPCCSEDVKADEDAQVMDAGTDSALIDGFEPDGSPPSPCYTEVLMDTDIEIDPIGPDTQIHASVCFDGEALWAAYSLPNPLGLFDVWATRINCNGEISVASFQISDTQEINEIAPRLSCSEEIVFIVWGADTGSNENNMEIHFTTLNRDGTPLMGETKSLETTRQGVAVHGNMMYPATDSINDESFWVAGVRGLEETGTFHVFLQEIDSTGIFVGEAYEPATEPGVTHSLPALSISPGKDVYLSWNRFEGSGEDEIFHTVFKSGSTGPDEPVNAMETVKAFSSAYWSGELSSVERVVLAVGSTGGNIMLTKGDILDPTEPFIHAGDATKMDHSPALAGGEDTGVLAFYRNISGLRNMVFIQPFKFEGSEIVLGEERMITEGPAAPYSLSLTYLGGNVFFSAWSEGISPDFRIKGRFFLSEP